MKKLMTMLAAVGMACSLFADAVVPNGTSFEGDSVTGEKTASDLTALDGMATWAYPDADTTATVTAYDGGEYDLRPAQFEDASQNNYLSFKTSLTNFITRTISGGVSAGPEGLYVDTLVRFTACDDDIDLAPLTTEGAKLAVWVKGVDADGDDPGSTNLMITAGYYNGPENVVVTNYVCNYSAAGLLDGKMHRLTIKSIADITSSGYGIVGFVVFVDGMLSGNVPVSTGAAVHSGSDAEWLAGLTGNAAKFARNGQLFPAINSADAKISVVGFSGQGAVDDISVTTTAPFDEAKDAAFYTVTWDRTIDSVNGVTGGTTNVLVTGNQDTFTYVAASGYISGSTNITGVANQTYEISAQKIAGTVYKREDESWVLVSGGEVATISEALALMTNTSDEYKLELGDNATDIVIDKSGYTITLDLAGKAVTTQNNTLTDAAIFVEAGDVTIIDSVGGATVTAFYDGNDWGYAVNQEGSGDITIEDGTYIGWVIATSLLGGRYAKSVYAETEPLEDMIVVVGLEVVEDTDTDYWKIQEFYGPIEIPVPEAYVGILYDGTLKTGVVEGVGYTLTGNTATDVGSYTATATLVSGYAWTGGSMEPTNIVWGIGAPVFQITYDLGGGTAGAGAPGTYAYNAEQQTVTLVAPTCEGSNFVSWVISSPVTQGLSVEGQTLTIPAGHMGDIALAATWSADSTTYVAGELVNCTDAAAAADLASQINANKETYIKVPSGIDNTGGAYTGLFQATAEGTIVSIRFTDDAATSQSNIVNTAATSIPISAIAAGVVGSQLVFVGTPGVYYSVSRATAIDGKWTEGTRQMAPASGTVTFLLGKDSEAAAEFFRVNAYEDDGRLY